jgi:hypothetical protein
LSRWGLVLVGQALFALCLVSAQQLLVPRNMPFGVAGPPSPVVAAVTSKAGLDLSAFPSQSAAMNAINQCSSTARTSPAAPVTR